MGAGVACDADNSDLGSSGGAISISSISESTRSRPSGERRACIEQQLVEVESEAIRSCFSRTFAVNFFNSLK